MRKPVRSRARTARGFETQSIGYGKVLADRLADVREGLGLGFTSRNALWEARYPDADSAKVARALQSLLELLNAEQRRMLASGPILTFSLAQR